MVSDAEEELAFQLKATNIAFEREYRFFPPRRFRFDFVITPLERLLAVEVEGGQWSGGHKQGAEYDSDCVKQNLAMMDGWRVLRFTPTMVKTGEALVTIEALMGKSL